MIHISSHSLTGEPLFHLRAGDASYVFCVFHGYLLHLYCGPAVGEDDLTALLVKVGHDSVVPRPADTPEGWFSLDIAPQEFPVYGTGDYRPSALMVRRADGSAATSLRYASHEVLPGKPVLDRQPATFAAPDEADTLAVTLRDPGSGLIVRLYYTALRDLPVVTRRAAAENPSDNPVTVERIASASLDFATLMEPAELLHLWGTWGRERTIERTPLAHGTVSVSSRRGASSHHHNPFAALVAQSTTETAGPAIGLSLVYAGNFEIAADTDPFGSIRFQAGIESTDFAWRLDPGETFVTPEAVLAISGEGLGKMSRTFHCLWREHLCRGEWAERERPVLVNNWEATYFKFNSEKLLAIAKDAAACGIEMLVMDDGWFGVRNDDRSSLGDWFVNEEKLPGGLAPLVERINALGLKFGIWFEPEMISPVSRLFDAHPDWALGTSGRDRSVARSQYVLDMTRPDVRDYLFDTISGVLSSANIEYVKWDFNRNLTEAASADLPPRAAGRDPAPLRARAVRPARPHHGGLPASPPRGLLLGRRAVRSGDAILRASVLDLGRHGRHGAPRHPARHDDGLSLLVDELSRLRLPESSDAAGNLVRDPRACGDGRRVRVRARPHDAHGRRKGPDPAPGRGLSPLLRAHQPRRLLPPDPPRRYGQRQNSPVRGVDDGVGGSDRGPRDLRRDPRVDPSGVFPPPRRARSGSALPRGIDRRGVRRIHP
ncbi:MAG: alpha-galactosidase, partial [Clostridia bacterium]|nr:alpha-galactosidase [Clostridia bacterium]